MDVGDAMRNHRPDLNHDRHGSFTCTSYFVLRTSHMPAYYPTVSARGLRLGVEPGSPSATPTMRRAETRTPPPPPPPPQLQLFLDSGREEVVHLRPSAAAPRTSLRLGAGSFTRRANEARAGALVAWSRLRCTPRLYWIRWSIITHITWCPGRFLLSWRRAAPS